MDVIQVRMPKKLIQEIDSRVKKGTYATRSDYVRAMVREQLRRHRDFVNALNASTGIVPDDGKDSVQQVRELRKRMTEKDYFPDG